MNSKQHTMVLAALIIVSFAAGAAEVYENVDSQGRVEFSDKPSSGAKTIDISPNVVDVVPVKPMAPSAPAPARAADTPTAGELPEAVPEYVDSGYQGEAGNRREKRQAIKERIEQGGRPVTLPAQQRPGNAPVHGGAHRR